MRRRLHLTALTVVAALLLTGCPSGDITSQASAELETIVTAAWEAADEGEVDRATGRLGELRDRAREHAADGEISDDRLEDILAAADEVEGLLVGLEEPEPDDGPDPDPPPEEEEQKEQKEKEKEKERDEDREKGKDEDR